MIGFWTRSVSVEAYEAALRALQLSSAPDWNTIQSACRRLAKLYHPDHGGDHEQFIIVRKAYEILAKYHQS